MPSSRLHAALFAFASLLLSACGGAPPPAATGAAPAVTVAHPIKRNISDWDGFVGQFEALQHVDVRPRVSGYVVEVAFQDGAQVKEGDLLFRIDPRPFEAVLDQARSQVKVVQTQLNNATTELNRAKDLLPLKAVSQEEFDKLNATVQSAKSELDAAHATERAAELNVGFTKIAAPISGRVSYHRVDVGNVVKADEALLTTVVSVDPMRFIFQGSEAMLLRYKRQNSQGIDGAPVRIRLQDETDYAWEGKLEFFDNAIDTASGTIRGRAQVQNPDGFIVPGMFGHLQLQAAAAYDGILLPDSAIATRGAARIVLVVGADNVVKAQPVELGPLNSGLRVIRSGLNGDEQVVVNGLQRAFPGSTVQPTLTTLEAPARP